MSTLLNRASVVALGLALSACVYASPYSTAFPDTPASTVNGRRVPAAGAATLCQRAHENPGSSAAVYACIRARGRDWDVRGHAIRRQASVVGQAAIPLGIASLGLSAAEDRSDFVPLTAGVTTTALAHTGAYARPDQARVYEMATAAYRCLESAVGEWNGLGAADMDEAYEALERKIDQTMTLLDSAEVGEHLDADKIRESKTEILRQGATARAVRNRLGGQAGRELLRRSGEIEDQVREAIGARMPDPQVVAASLIRPASGDRVETPPNVPPPAPEAPREVAPPPGETETNKARREAANRDAAAAAREAARVVGAVRTRMTEVNNLTARFDAAANAFNEQARAIPVACVFNPIAVPALGDPGDVTLNDAYEGSFLMQGGVPPYGYHVLPRDGLSITVQPLGTGWRFDLKATAASTGPWAIYVNDSSSVNGMTEVTVTKKPATPSP